MRSTLSSYMMAFLLGAGMVLGLTATTATTAWAQADDAATIRTVQRALAAKGHNPGPIDGIMGPRTRAALEAFQETQGIRVTGRIDDRTLQALGITRNRDNILQKAGRATARGATTAAGATARGATTAAGATARGATTVAKTTAQGATTGAKKTAEGATVAASTTKKGAVVAAKSTKKGATVAAKSTKKGVTTAAEATGQGAKATARGAQTVGQTTASGAKRASDEVRGVLGLGASDEAIQRRITKHLDEDEIIDASRVRVLVESGVVTLTVSGLSQEDQDRAVAIARRVKAVKDVVVR